MDAMTRSLALHTRHDPAVRLALHAATAAGTVVTRLARLTLVALAAAPRPALAQASRFVDLDRDVSRHVVVDREAGQYLGHVSTILLGDGRTILAAYPKGHGEGAIILKRSEDGGRTWSDRLPTPANWTTSKETPTLFRVPDPIRGGHRILLFSGLHPARMASSDDEGRTWTPLAPIGNWGGIVVMGSVVPMADGSLLAFFHDDGRFFRAGGKAEGTFRLFQVRSRDGGRTWEAPREIWRGTDIHLCEPGAIRSPDGHTLALLLRENRRRRESHVMVTTDEGRTWSTPRPMDRALTGDRHTAQYARDGRLVVTFRDVAEGSPTKGDWVAWVGRWEDLLAGTPGQYRVRIKDNTNQWDSTYPGLERLGDGSFVATTYGHWEAGQPPYILSARFRLEELDARSAFDGDRLARIDRYLQAQVDSARIAGAVALVLRDGEVVYERAVGWADREANRPMRPDHIFRIASQSKAITSTAVMMLVEEGQLALGDPVSRWLPTFPRTTVANPADTGRTTIPARRAITIFDLLTHTAGISYGTEASVAARYRAAGLGPAAGFGWYTADKAEPICTSMDRLGTLPFVAQPGERFVYGYNTDILGCVVERASGLPLDRFLESRLLAPLGMRDTRFFVTPTDSARLVTVYRTDDAGRAVRADTGARGQGHYVNGPRTSFAGGAGLTSTARDYARFLEMLRRGGAIDGQRYLAPRTVELMTTNQIGTRYSADGNGYSLAFSTVDRLGANGFSSVGSYNWGGAYASIYAVDPAERLVMVLMLNNLPGTPEARARFGTLVYQALVR
jgi:CubicO group peptidase (beta-lactamase class C family)